MQKNTHRRDTAAFSSAWQCRLECLFHLDSTRLEDMEKVPVATFEVFEHLCQLLFSGIGLEAQNSTDNSIGAGLVGGVEVLGLDRRFEGGAQPPWRDRVANTKSVDFKKHSLRQTSSLRPFVGRAWQAFRRSGANSGGGWRVLPPRQRVRTDARPGKTEKVGNCPFRTSILIWTIGGERASRNLHHWARSAKGLKVVAAQIPIQCTHCSSCPLGAVVEPPCRKAC